MYLPAASIRTPTFVTKPATGDSGRSDAEASISMLFHEIATSYGPKRSRGIEMARFGGSNEADLIADAKTEQDRRYQSDAWDERIDRWLVYERQRLNHGHGNYDDWREEEVERPNPLCDVSVGEILEGALGIEPARWTRSDQMRVTACLKARGWERYQARIGPGREAPREWRYRC